MGSPAMNEPSVTASRAYSPEVMVSYSSHDRAQVMQFVQRLRAAGVAAWIDQGGIDGAQRWGEEIVNAIDSCKTVLLMISQTSMQSENIAKEVMLAWENNKHFLPLCLEDAKIAKSMQYQLAGIQQIKLYEGDPEAKFVAVLRALVRLGVHVSPYYIAMVSADLGEREQAFEWLGRACEQRSSSLARLKTESRFSVLHGDPRFVALIKRMESLPLEEEGAIPDVPVVLPRPMVQQTAAPAKPAPLWKKILWPDIYDGASARQAAAQGVWMPALLVFLTILAVIFPPAPGSASLFGPGSGTATAFLIMLMLGAIGFGVQKMGRPAAIIGLVICASGALQNLTKVQQASATLDAYSAQYRQYEQSQQQYPQYSQVQNPMVQAYQQASSLYYGSWFALLVSLISVGAFTNATRGTLGYRRMVMARTTPDRQDAVTGEDLAAIKGKIMGMLGKSRTAAPAPVAVAPAPTAAPPVTTQPTRPQPGPIPVSPIATASIQPVSPTPPLVVTLAPTEAVLVAPVVVVEPVRQSFAAMIGVSGGLIYWPRVLAFLVANVAAGVVFVLSRSLTASASVSAAYWLWAICAACVFTAATVVGFRFVPNVWAAMAVAAGIATLVTVPFYAMLPTFLWADIGYREQFQQFILLPLIGSFILLVALSWVVPRLQPMVLALWLAAMGTEIATSVVLNLLHVLGAGEPPDAVLGGASVISAVLRSLAFALVLWGGLEYLRKQAAKATAA
jgi:hypothetical protein